MYGFKLFVDAENDVKRKIVDLYLNRDDLKVVEIAQICNKSEAEVYRILHSYDVSPNRQKVNHQKVRNLSELGWNVKQISEFTGYTPRNVRYILAKS
jgi:hypothetical protein